MTNHLSRENSPYLLQHAENPVDWYPWGEEALSKAKMEDKPIFLSIGYAACHWCHVMAHESFEDENTARFLNEHFISIKVDREERPDLDAVYMNAVNAITGQGGWPMSLFLTPYGKPFFGGTYFPPFPRYNMPAFIDVLESVIDSWKTERTSIETTGDRLVEHIKTSVHWKTTEIPSLESLLNSAEDQLLKQYDWIYGGWGHAPKFPQSMAIDFLLKKATRGQGAGLKAACHALDTMSKGGMYDLVGGGFHRYSTDNHWLVPHFEKMLYDNALLARAYLHAFLMTGTLRYRKICEATLDFILRDMTHPDGGFYSSLDADTGGEEGKTYTWSQPELTKILGPRFELFTKAFTISNSGNFYGTNILQSTAHLEDLAAADARPVIEIEQEIKTGLELLFEARKLRPQPPIDDKILAGWNGLALVAFAEAGRFLDRADYLTAARKNAHFILSNMLDGQELKRSWRAGRALHSGTLEDYASLSLGLLSLYMADGNPTWYQTVENLSAAILERFSDSEGGFFDNQPDTNLPIRPKEYQDNAVPSGSALAAQVFLCLADFSDRSEYREIAEIMLSQVYQAAGEYPTAFAYWLQALDYAAGPVTQIALLNVKENMGDEFLGVINAKYDPRSVLAASSYPPPPSSPHLLADRPLIHGNSTVYVCRQFVCQMPVTDPVLLRQQLENPTEPG